MNSSDEAVEALARMLSTHERSWQWDHVSHEGDRQFWRGEAREAMDELRPLIAAAVRAEAVADERQRVLRELADLAKSDGRAAGSVPVATPEPVQCSDDAYTCPACFPVGTPPTEPATGEQLDKMLRHAIPSQPVTCEHGKTRQHYDFLTGCRCAGPVSVPKESSE